MRWRPLTWLLLSVMFFTAAYYFWRRGDEWAAAKRQQQAPTVHSPGSSLAPALKPVAHAPAPLLTTPDSLTVARKNAEEKRKKLLSHRLTNTTQTVGQLVHNSHALLLENALFDTQDPLKPAIPQHLQAKGDPGAYIVQARGPVDDAFRARLQAAGATIISYIPNNAYLVRASQSVADALTGPETQAVVPYEPYYKIKASLLGGAIASQPLAPETQLNVLLFDDTSDATLEQIKKLGAQVLGQDRSPFGPVFRVQPPVDSLALLAGLPGVQEIEPAHVRKPANDLSRARVGVSTNTQTTANYLDLSGSNIIVAVVDTGVDTNHPDLGPIGRVILDVPSSGVDINGHGTHVAGIIAGNGQESMTVSNAQGSIMPATNGQFRGMAPLAKLFSMTGGSDQYLQETAVRTNALISNNSWTYGDNGYDLGAASYDAAVRDSVPEVTGSQPLVFVFPAGNAGGVNVWDDGSGDDGQGGVADSILSPGTAKNVITVGAIEQFRNITNQVLVPNGTGTNGNPIITTNLQWQPSTDSSNQVAGFSSRGNVGISIEGDFGRFKPDVVAPGTFVVSTRSTQWDTNAYYNPTSHTFQVRTDITVNTNTTFADEFFIPNNAVQVDIGVFPNANSPVPFPPTPIYVKHSAVPTNGPGGYDFVGTNQVRMPRDFPLNPVGDFWFYAVGNATTQNVSLNIQVDITVTNLHGNFLDELATNLNAYVGPWYRYESGTSLAAADVSGNLALMEEFFGERLGLTNISPALLKALLINGARSLGSPYDFEVDTAINHQGWGLISLPNSLPTALSNVATAASSPILIFDQNPTNALITGQSQTRVVHLSDSAQSLPLRVTLVWTDPPGNPVAGVKLVNNLDLVVTNLDTGDVFFGNDILSQNQFNLPWDTVSPPNTDSINNVENVYLGPPLGTNYSITVVGTAVNVNAVTAHTNNVAQDYALVVTSGDGTLTNALTLTNNTPLVVTPNVPLVTLVTNMFVGSPNVSGGILLGQHAGANTPLLGLNFVPVTNAEPITGPVSGQITLGMTNQWHFYAITNDQGFTNAAFLTFLPPTLSMPRMGVEAGSQANATRTESDIDLYVSTDPALTNLGPNAVAGALKSLGRGGTETIVISNAVKGMYYIGVKAESQEAAEYAFMGVFSLLPFGSSDANGDQLLQGFPVPMPIPDATTDIAGGVKPGAAYIFAIAVQPALLRRVIVTNTITHQLMGDLQTTLIHDGTSVVLDDHAPDGQVVDMHYVFDDSAEKNVTIPALPNWTLRRSDGPGSLNNFAAGNAVGQWMLVVVDGAPGHVGTNNNFTLFLEKQQALTNGINANIQPGACRSDYIDVPIGATNLTVTVSVTAGTGPISFQVCPTEGGGCQSMTLGGAGSGGSLTIDKFSNPPLNPGTYVVRLCNLGPDVVSVHILAKLLFDFNGVQPTIYRGGPAPIVDDAVSYSTIDVTNDSKIVSLEVGLRVDHPRVSDVDFHLISPNGTRLSLCENRGGLSTNGMGLSIISTNIIPVSANGGPEGQTNSIDTGRTSGTISISWNMYAIPDRMTVYYESNLLFDSGYVSYTGSTNLTYGPGNSTVVTIVMNQGGSPYTNPPTAWTYTVTSTEANYIYFTFTENTNLTTTPVKFAPPPFVPGASNTGIVFSNSFEAPAPGIYTNGQTFDGWTVNTNQVAVINDPTNDYDGGQYLQLGVGDVSRPLPTQGGHNYVLSFYYKLDNGPYFDGSFESPAPRAGGVYTNGQTFGGWVVAAGDVNDYVNFAAGGWQPADGVGSLDLNGNSGASGVIYHDIATIPGEPYILRFAYAGNPGGGPNPKTMQISWDGTVIGNTSFLMTTQTFANMGWVYTNINVAGTGNDRLQFASTIGTVWGPALDAISLIPLGQGEVSVTPAPPLFLNGTTNWQLATISFTAQGPNTILDLHGITNGLDLDNFTLTDNGSGSIYVQPEESLDKFKRENAKGNWTLEMLDDRAGATNPTPTVVSWQLSFIFENQVPAPTPLQHNETVTNTICANQIQYYSVTVPNWVAFATNILSNVSGGNVNLLFNQNAPPTGTNGVGDATLQANSTGGTTTLSGLSTPPLLAGQIYYLAVQNTNTNCVTYQLTLDFNVYPLTLNVAVPNQINQTFPPQYYSYNVLPTETGVSFQLTNLSGNVNLVASKGLPPFPDPSNFEYGSFNPGTNPEQIIVFTNSDPVVLSPGQWYLGVFNADTNNVNYTIVVTDYTNPVPNIITLFNGIPYYNTNNPANSPIDYYQYFVSTNAVRAQFEIYSTNGPVNNMALVIRHDLPLPTLANYDYFSATNDDLITVFNNSTPVPLTPGQWFVSAINMGGATVPYTIMASDWPQYGTNVTLTGMSIGANGLCFTWNGLAGVNYFVQGKTNLLDPNWITIPPLIMSPSATPTWCTPFPTPYHFFRIGQRLN